jgi:S-adenosylmethionine hydrolase
MKPPVVALLTDFGEDDWFVASMKGVMLGILPSLRFIDISHTAPAFDPGAAGFLLFAAHRDFPAGTIFLCVVDPGVGTSRRILLAEAGGASYIAPDNGILSRILRAGDGRVRTVVNRELFRPQTGRTFEGRDRMAPAAAHLASGVPPETFGPLISDYLVLPCGDAVEKGGRVAGRVVYRDRFGNCITDIREEAAERIRERTGAPAVLEAAGRSLPAVESYGAAAPGQPVYLVSGLGYLEIAVREDSAAELLGLVPGDPAELKPAPSGRDRG